MKFSFMTWSTPDLTFEDTLALAARLGYDGIEPRIDGGQRHGVEVAATAPERTEIRRKAADGGIEICCIATSLKYADPETVAVQVEHTRRCLDLCADIGAPRLRVFGGEIPPGVTREQAIDLLASSLRSVADQASRCGVAICVETHDHWSDPRPLAEAMRRANHPAIGINWDFIHPWWRASMEPDESFAVVRPWLRHVHVHDGIRQADGNIATAWIGEGQVDHRRAIELLRSIGYDGYLSGEWIGREPGYEEYLPRELATLRSYRDEAG